MVVKLFELERHTALQAVNGRCVRCHDRLVWIVINGQRRPSYDSQKASSGIDSDIRLPERPNVSKPA